MNEELIKQCAREGAAKAWEDCKDIPPAASKSLAQQARSGDLDDFEAVQAARNAIRLYHACHVARLVEAAQQILLHAGIADAAPEDIDGEDHEREASLRKALAPFQQEAK
ncbi:hypothetical protein [Pedomonas sp. V897]|uniref:hypothetical protein n=1 Tax=Pedomonas sp. V897 TaxID=3446482 RepID=UPI003EDEC9A5